MITQTSGSAQQAEAILRAWHDGNQGRFQKEVDAVAGLVTSSRDTSEMERVEILQGIAAALCDEERRTLDPNTHVYCDLLRHLAFGPVSMRRNEGTAIRLVG
jgi:hypothetical protein